MGCQGRLFFVFISLRFASVCIFSINLFLNSLSFSSVETSLLLNPPKKFLISDIFLCSSRMSTDHSIHSFILNFNCWLKLSTF